MRDSRKSRAIALIGLPSRYSRRIFVIISKIKIPVPAVRNPNGGASHKEKKGVNFARRFTLNRKHELTMHVKGAIRNGVTKEEIREVLLQVVIYAGVPAGVDSFRTAKEALAELDE